VPHRPRLTPAIADVRRAVRNGFEQAGLQPKDTVLVACSGGADSLALAAAVAFEADRFDLRAAAVVVEHGLQPETVEVAKSTALLLTELGFELVSVRPVSVNLESGNGGTEAAAREARYEAINAFAHEISAKAILLGHTLNDQAETVLLGLARGSGSKSLNGMKTWSSPYLRPMLGLTRKTTESFCADSGLSVWNDPQNNDPQYARVRIRQQILPLLEEQLGPGIAENLAKTAELLREDDEFLAQSASLVFKQAVQISATSVTLQVDALAEAHPAIRNRVIKQALELFGGPYSRVHVLAVVDLIVNWHGQKPLALPSVRVERKGSHIALRSTKTLNPGAC
jgi:tRNA(Ile)-lysidine synthase